MKLRAPGPPRRFVDSIREGTRALYSVQPPKGAAQPKKRRSAIRSGSGPEVSLLGQFG